MFVDISADCREVFFSFICTPYSVHSALLLAVYSVKIQHRSTD